MDQRNLTRLEYHKIISLLEQCCSFSLSKEYAKDLNPMTDLNQIIEKQKETTEAKEIFRSEPELPLSGFRDIRNILRKAFIGGILEPTELLTLSDMLSAMRKLKTFFRDKKEKYPIIYNLTEGLCSLRDLEDTINRSIEPGGTVSDNASPQLLKLRRRINELQLSMKEKMDSIVRSSEFAKFLQEPLVTMRQDRYVVPVKQEYKSRFPGIVHDQSASGATLFIEPMSVVEKSNELRRVMSEEKQEIIRILTDITGLIRVHHDEIAASTESAGKIDLIFAKGKLSHQMDAGEPVLTDRQQLNLISARHPLLKGNAVPINVWLGKDFRILVITGPNTGGKTVALKTVGLLVAMAQSGLHIPAETGSETGVFQEIFVDIGDEQSIEQSLSTFSSHMTNIIRILDKADDKSLVLFDELGAGTDPTEGAALAIAILDFLDRKKVRTIATTHYSELKAFAFNRLGVENASVEFDIKTLRPTYRLNIGQPGSSSAFEIAERLGLAGEIIDSARKALSKENIQVTDLIRELEDNKRSSEIERNEAVKLKKEMQQLRDEYQRKMSDLAARRIEIMEKARIEAEEILRKARLQSEELLKEIKDAVAEGASQQALLTAQKARNKLKQLQYSNSNEHETIAEGKAPKDVKPGQEVLLPKYNQYGCVISPPDSNGSVQVQVGIMKLNVPLSELRLKKEKPAVETGAPKVMAGKAKEINTEIDLRGLTVEEALEAVEKYLDDAYLAGLPKIYIIHGKGTGALRKAITNLLSGHRFVKGHRLGQYGEGGTGVTVVEIN